MTRDYRDVKSLDTEDEGDRSVGTDFSPPQPWGRRVCPGRHLILVLLGFLCILAIAVIVFGFTGRKLDDDLSELRGNLKKINHTIFSELAALKEKEGNEGKTLTKINVMAKNLTEQMKEAKTHFQEQISKLQTGIHRLNCELEDVKHNRSGASKGTCCPKGWLAFSRNCYWFSKMERNWEEAKADCENKDAHLVTIASYLEQQFVAQHTKPLSFWIGLSYTNQSWKWVDGTAYTVRRIDWRPREPNNYSYLTPGEQVCVLLYRDGLWSDNDCRPGLNWVCEMEAKS